MNGVILRASLAVTLLALAFPATSFGQAATVGASSGDTDAGATVGCIAAGVGALDTTAGATVEPVPAAEATPRTSEARAARPARASP
jgi:hypothetical protein